MPLSLFTSKSPSSTRSCQVHQTECTNVQQGLVEFWSIASPQVQGASVVDVKASTKDSTTPDDLVDVEYLEYEQHVHARARALETSSKFGFGWKTLRFWKRRHGPTVLGAGGVKPFISAAATPLPNHHHHDPFRTPKARTPGRNIGSVHGNSYSRPGCATFGPVYYHESPSSMQRQFSHRRAWRDHEVCNMSPYVALSDRRSRAASPVPLYFV